MRIGIGMVLAGVVTLAMATGCAREKPRPATTPPGSAIGAPAATPPPAGSPLAGIREGMRPEEVQKIAGPPSTIRPYITGKAFIPWYSGPDRTRTAYYYKGQGRVVFSGDGGLGTNSHVLSVEYDATDPGAPR